MPRINMESLLPFIEEAFNRGVDFQIPITGTSMNPLLYQNRDFAKIVKPQLPLKLGDIPLYRRADGSFILHRVVGIKENGEYIMCGDNQFLLEYGITDKNIIGVVKTLIIDSKEIDVETDADYLKHKKKYLKNLKTRYPIRRLRHKLHFVKLDVLNFFKPENQQDVEKVDNDAIKDDVLKTASILIDAIKAQITGNDFAFPENTEFAKLFSLAQNHRVTAMVAPMVMKCDFADGQTKGVFGKELFKTAARYTAQEKEYKELSDVLSQANIKHCFLKGTKVSSYYKNPDSRFMLDMDLYVESEKFTDAEKILVSRGYECNSFADDKDISYIKLPFLIVELHKALKYDYDKGYEYYKGAFERMVSDDDFAMHMTDEDFYVYILSHTAHHFETAGTGIKSIIDHYYLKENLKPKCDLAVLADSLSRIGLEQFSSRMDQLCDCWFEDGEWDEATREMAEYVFLSGVFGNSKNKILSGVANGRFGDSSNKYLLKRLLPPMKVMRRRYSILKKLPFLLPLFWGIRILSSVFDRKRIVSETRSATSSDAAQVENQKSFLNNMGL